MTWSSLVVSLLLPLVLFFPFAVAQATSDEQPLHPLPDSIPSLSIPAIPALFTLPPLNSSHPLLSLSLPALSSTYLTLNLCSLPSGWNASSAGFPEVLVSRDTARADTEARDEVGRWTFAKSGSGSKDAKSGGTAEGGANSRGSAKDGKGDVWRMQWDKGFANWTYVIEEGKGEEVAGVKVLIGMGLRTDGNVRTGLGEGNVVLQLGVSSSGPLHTIDPTPPFISDTTSSTALIFSRLIGSSQPLAQPRYPNYTIPALPSIPPLNTSSSSSSSFSSYSLIVVPTDASPTNAGLDNSQCAARLASTNTGNLGDAGNMVLNRTEPAWMRIGPDGEGYRTAWGVGGLESERNYTVWVEWDGGMSGPAWFRTKSSTFSCALLLPTTECPGISYAAPLPAPDLGTTTTVPSPILSSLPNTTLQLLSANLASFRTSLLFQACGRDVFSHVSTCLDCHEAYRDWLCHMLIPRCADPSPSPSDTSLTLSGMHDDKGQIIPQAVISRTPSPYTSSLGIQNLGLSPATEQEGMQELAPCLATCHAVERQCPAFLKFRCPHYSNGASRRYGFHGERSKEGNGAWGGGWAGVDKWGGAWCAL